MTSNLKIIRMFFEYYEDKDSNKVSSTDIDSEWGLKYRSGLISNPDIILFNNTQRIFYIVDYHQNVLLLQDMTVKINFFRKDDIKTMDDMELLLKYGRSISDDVIIQNIKTNLNLDIKLDNFKDLFLPKE